jgi:hypothetical protein
MAEYLLFVRLDSRSLVQYGDPPRRSLHFQVRSVSLVTRAAESIETLTNAKSDLSRFDLARSRGEIWSLRCR